MKNMKIGAKIMLGFGIVIAMMLVVAVVVVSSNVSSLNNVNMISENSTLQTLSADLRSNFLNARVPANLLKGTLDPATYEQFVSLSDTTAQSFSDVNAFIAQNPVLEKFRSPILTAQDAFEKWRANGDVIGKANEEQAEFYAQLVAGGNALSETTNFILEEQFTTLVTEINTDVDTSGLLRRVARTKSASDITMHIANGRVLSRQITGSFDATNLPDALEAFDTAIQMMTVYRDESLRDVQKESSQKAIDAITAYRNALEGFGEACARANEAQRDMPTLNDAVQNAMTEALNAIDEAMETRVSSTEVSAQSSLVIVIVILIIAVLSAVAMAVVIMRGITVPVGKMHRLIEVVGSTGRMEFSGAEKTDIESAVSKDEIGQSIGSFVKMLDRLEVVASALKSVAAGDLTVVLKPITDEDTMGLAVSSMVDSLNNMFAEIKTSTVQVSSGASQIADGAQMLAQGATEQSATVEQLSASVAEISEQTIRNASVAEETRALEDSIKRDAEKGAAQMEQMMQAVKDISEASQSIGKVIKIIDDIAFQTNILALNAAVEAARAGQHGKGFAVVADEVRNLAAKSAAAAKDTGVLIETSIQKSQMGAGISEETSKSLNDIVSGILRSSEMVANIAKSSNEQSAAIGQISEAIDQVSQVVQQNSATSEQSAAASQEMSGQAMLLQQLIAQFKLRNANSDAPVLSVASNSAQTGFAIK